MWRVYPKCQIFTVNNLCFVITLKGSIFSFTSFQFKDPNTFSVDPPKT